MAIWVLMSTMFLTNIGFGVILPTLPILSLHLGASAFEMGLAISVFSVASLFASSIWGAVSDRIGRRPVLIFGVVGYGVVSALLPWAPNVAVLLMFRFLAGMMAAAVFPSSLALVAEWTTSEDRPRILGYMGSVNGIGFICGPPVGALLSVYGVAVPFVCVGLLSVINGLLALRLLPRVEKREEEEGQETDTITKARISWLQRMTRSLQNRMIAPLLIGTFVISLVDSSISATLSYFFIGPLQSTQTMAGWGFMVNAAVSSLAQATVFSRVFTRFGDVWTIIIGLSFGVAGYLIFGLSSTLFWAFGALGLLALCGGMAYPAITTSISIHTPRELQGSIFGTHSTVGSLGRTLGPLIAGGLFSYQERSPFLFASGLLFATVGFYVVWMYKMRNHAPNHPQTHSVQKTME
ncbi:MFS transporter [Brevibacillus choshinensis]|uniref:MFS transporter n=1 Tax=Brevibacillus choshinensis TaxID=54911 RepID=A0ABX7FKP4_BRECH|nr:MFS transporter [Brevibacillus choshinensis]QRG66798.1 MFS transporter [Brevibacillus choshinensis]